MIVAVEQLSRILLANHYGPGQFGVYNIGMSLYLVSTVFILFGSEQVLLRNLSENRNNRELRESYLLLSFFMTIVLFCIFIIFSYFAINIEILFSLTKEDSTVIYYFLWMVLPIAFLRIIWAQNRALGENKKYFFNKFIYYELIIIIIYLTGIYFDISLNNLILLQLMFVGMLAVCFAWKEIIPIINPSRMMSLNKILKDYYAIAGNMTFSLFMAEVRKRLDIIILAAWLSKEQLGVYSFCLLLSRFPTLIQASFNQFLLPTMVLARQRGDKEFIQDRYSLVQEVNMLISIPILFYFMCMPADVLNVLGKSYSSVDASHILAAFAMIYLFVIFAGSWGQVLIAENKTSVTSVLSALALIINLAGLFVLVPWLGASGAVITVGITLIISNFIGTIFVISKYHILPVDKNGFAYIVIHSVQTFVFIYTINKLNIDIISKISVTCLIPLISGTILFFFFNKNNRYRKFINIA